MRIIIDNPVIYCKLCSILASAGIILMLVMSVLHMINSNKLAPAINALQQARSMMIVS